MCKWVENKSVKNKHLIEGKSIRKGAINMIGQSLIETPTLEEVLIDNGFQLREIPLLKRTLVQVSKDVSVNKVPVSVYVATYDMNREDEAIKILKNVCDLNLYGLQHDEIMMKARYIVNGQLKNTLNEYEQFYKKNEKRIINESRC